LGIPFARGCKGNPAAADFKREPVMFQVVWTKKKKFLNRIGRYRKQKGELFGFFHTFGVLIGTAIPG